ncbi:hypothetical protein [Robertmurraya sp. P23]
MYIEKARMELDSETRPFVWTLPFSPLKGALIQEGLAALFV